MNVKVWSEEASWDIGHGRPLGLGRGWHGRSVAIRRLTVSPAVPLQVVPWYLPSLALPAIIGSIVDHWSTLSVYPTGDSSADMDAWRRIIHLGKLLSSLLMVLFLLFYSVVSILSLTVVSFGLN